MADWNSLVVSLLCGGYEHSKANNQNFLTYRTFGNHDTIKITPVQGENSNEILQRMFKITNEYSHNMVAGESIHNLFAVTDDCGCFWENEMPYLFISAIQINFSSNNVGEQFSSFKSELTSMLSEEGYVINESCSIYHSLDCGDVLLFLKTNTYLKGANTINKITVESESRHYGYSLCAVNERLLKSKLAENDEIIPKVVICSVFADSSNYENWISSFKNEYRNEFRCRNCSDFNGLYNNNNPCPYICDEYVQFARLGNEDICINIFNCSMKHLLDMLYEDSGVFSHKNTLVTSTFTRLRIQFDSEIIYKTSPKREPLETISLIKSYSNDWKSVLEEYSNPYVFKALSEIFASIENLELKDFAFDVQDCVKNVFPLFMSKIVKYQNSNSTFSNSLFNKHLIYFATGILSIANSTLHADKLFINVPGFNAVPCDAPSKLLAYYTSYIQELVFVLNDSSTFDYRFLLCPDLYLGIEVEKLFNYKENDSQLLKARIPISKLFDPQGLLMELSHEVAHFVGTTIRERKFRISILSQIISYKLTDIILRPVEFDCCIEGIGQNKESDVIFSLLSSENQERSFDDLLEKDWISIPNFIKSKLEDRINIDNEDSLYLNVVNETFKENILSLLVNDYIGELQNLICEVVINNDIHGDKADEIFFFSSLINRHINELLLVSYSQIIDDCCALCSESFADMVMLYITEDPRAYLYKIYEIEKNTFINTDGEDIYPWEQQQFKVIKYERIISVFNALQYRLDEIDCNEDELFQGFLKKISTYAMFENGICSASSKMAIIQTSRYLSMCLSELKKHDANLEKVKKLYRATKLANLDDCINEFRKANFDFRKDISNQIYS